MIVVLLLLVSAFVGTSTAWTSSSSSAQTLDTPSTKDFDDRFSSEGSLTSFKEAKDKIKALFAGIEGRQHEPLEYLDDDFVGHGRLFKNKQSIVDNYYREGQSVAFSVKRIMNHRQYVAVQVLILSKVLGDRNAIFLFRFEVKHGKVIELWTIDEPIENLWKHDPLEGVKEPKMKSNDAVTKQTYHLIRNYLHSQVRDQANFFPVKGFVEHQQGEASTFKGADYWTKKLRQLPASTSIFGHAHFMIARGDFAFVITEGYNDLLNPIDVQGVQFHFFRTVANNKKSHGPRLIAEHWRVSDTFTDWTATFGETFPAQEKLKDHRANFHWVGGALFRHDLDRSWTKSSSSSASSVNAPRRRPHPSSSSTNSHKKPSNANWPF